MTYRYALALLVSSAGSPRAFGASAPPTMFVVDASLSMANKDGTQQSRFETMKAAFGDALGQVPVAQPVGLSALGTSRGCAEGNAPVLTPVGSGPDNRRAIKGALDNLVSGYSTPLVLALQKAVQNVTGVLVPTTPEAPFASYSTFSAKPDPGKDRFSPTPDAPVVVVISDLAETCKLDACKFMRDLEEKHVNVRIRALVIGAADNEKAEATRLCMDQFLNFDSADARTQAKLKDGLAKVFNGDDLRAPAQSQTSQAPLRSGRNQIYGRVVPAETSDEPVEPGADPTDATADDGTLHAVALPLNSQ